MSLFGLYTAAKIGATTQTSFSAGSSNRRAIVGAFTRPKLFILRATQDVHIRQGGSTVTASTSDLLLRAGTYFPLLIERGSETYLATYGATAGGDLEVTNGSEV